MMSERKTKSTWAAVLTAAVITAAFWLLFGAMIADYGEMVGVPMWWVFPLVFLLAFGGAHQRMEADAREEDRAEREKAMLEAMNAQLARSAPPPLDLAPYRIDTPPPAMADKQSRALAAAKRVSAAASR